MLKKIRLFEIAMVALCVMSARAQSQDATAKKIQGVWREDNGDYIYFREDGYVYRPSVTKREYDSNERAKYEVKNGKLYIEGNEYAEVSINKDGKTMECRVVANGYKATLTRQDWLPKNTSAAASKAKPIMADEADFEVGLTDDDSGCVINGYNGYGENIIIPATIQGFPVKEIGREAFRYKNIRSVVIPNSVTEIGHSAFNGCSYLESVVISDSVTKIGGYAFYECKDLESVKFPSDPFEIGERAFYKTGIKELTITGNMTFDSYYYTNQFYACAKLEKVVFESDVKEINHEYVISSSSLKEVVFKSPDTKIRKNTIHEDCIKKLPLAMQAEVKKHIAD